MRQDHSPLVHRRPEATELGRDLGARRQAGHQRVRRPWEEGRLHAAGDRAVRRVHHPGDDDVFRVDIRHGHRRNRRPAAVSAAVPRPAFPEPIGEESQVCKPPFLESSLPRAPLQFRTRLLNNVLPRFLIGP